MTTELITKEDVGIVDAVATGISPEGIHPETGNVTPSTPVPTKPEEKKENPTHIEFLNHMKPIMDKVKANQTVTYDELKKAQEIHSKIGV